MRGGEEAHGCLPGTSGVHDSSGEGSLVVSPGWRLQLLKLGTAQLTWS